MVADFFWAKQAVANNKMMKRTGIRRFTKSRFAIKIIDYL
jgi:hypothetical protein